MNKRLQLILFTLVSLLLLFSSHTYAQEKRVTIKLKNASLKEVFDAIEKQTTYRFSYRDIMMDTAKDITLSKSDATVSSILDDALKGKSLKYSIVSSQSIVISDTRPIEKNDRNQLKKISGIVTDENKEPIIGVAVSEKGTTNGVITDVDGKYTLNVSDQSTIAFSYVGYLPQDVKVANKTDISVVLVEDSKLLDEIVVVGYGVQKKRDLTGAVSSVKMDDAPVGTLSTVSHALAGKAAGLRVIQNTAQPGAGATFRIRGETSINAGNDPLVIIDGFPVSKSASSSSGNRYESGSQDNVLEMINPNDIESIEVLKDASATAIYGSRAGHGVIIITTKRGKAGKPGVTYSGNASVQTISNKYKLMDAPEYMKLNNMYGLERWRRETETGIYADYVVPKPNTPDYKPTFTEEDIANAKTTDWMDEISRTGFQQSHNISISGGTEMSKYLASLNYFEQKGVMKNNDMSRFTINLNSDYELSKYTKAGLSFNLSRNSYNNVALGTGTNEYAGLINAAAFFEPNLPVRNENGDYSESVVYRQRPNPVSLLENKDNQTKDRIIGSGFIAVEPIKGLIFKANLGFDRRSSKHKTYLPTTTLYGKTENGAASQRQDDGMDYLFNLTANYMKTTGNHSFTGLVGYEWQRFTEEWFSARNTNFSMDKFLYNNLNAGSGQKSVGSNYTRNELASLFARANYSYADKYLLTATVRADAASNFNPDNRWGYFPSVSAGWRFSEETFIKNTQSILSNGKLRGGYGQTGNSNIGNRTENYFKAESKWVFGNAGTTGMNVTSLGNSKITWETTSEWNIGMDLGFLNNRINFTAEYYDRVVSNLLVTDKRLPVYNEIASIAANVGSTQGQGFELALNTVNIKRSDLVWITDLTFYTYRDRWKKRDPNWIPRAYESVNDDILTLFAYRSNGLLKPGDPVQAWQKGLLPGQVILQSQTDDNVLGPQDIVRIGSKDPQFAFGFNNTVRYKEFDLNVYFYGEVGRWRDASYYDSWIPYYVYPLGAGLFNGSEQSLNSWTMDNQSSSVPNILAPASTGGAGDYFMKKISFIRCRNITVGYNIPPIKNIANKIRVHATVNNPFVISNWSGLDPETDYNPSDVGAENARSNSYPNVRTFSIGVDINF